MNTDANNSAASRLRNVHSGEKHDPLERRTAQHATHLPSVTPWLLRAFSAYSGWYVARHIHSIRISRTCSIPNVGGLPLVIYVNHAAWWDPLVCLALQNAFFGKRQAYAPIDSQALQKYRFFSKLGFFPVDQHSRLGASQFIRTAEAVLSQPDSILWLTPQGRFADVRERPVRFKPGLGHLPPRIPRAAFVPLALEYTHWEERKPEVLCRFGPIEIAGGTTYLGAMKDLDWTRHFEQQLQSTQDSLAVEAQNRVAGSFDVVMRSSSGVGFFYDTCQALRAAVSGQTFQREHGNL